MMERGLLIANGVFHTALLGTSVFFISGVGHGWSEPFSYFWAGALFYLAYPLVKILYPNKTWIFCLGALVLGIYCDISIYQETVRNHNTHIPGRTFASIPLIMLLWAYCWLAWQLYSLYVLLEKIPLQKSSPTRKS